MSRKLMLLFGVLLSALLGFYLLSEAETWRHLFGYCISFHEGRCYDMMLDPKRIICTFGALGIAFATPFTLRGMLIKSPN
jgi:hypothetical protein